eukprot:GFKZ01007684.1.p1 GENE.GFKZ01007684.1~~GFKZ01007684.1.p1  ORF type:complete len:607 (+),score=76.96 GFKZ01007684.1:35-1822(+)
MLNPLSAREVVKLLSLVPPTSPTPLDLAALLHPLLHPLCTPSLLNFLTHPTLHLTPFLSPSLPTLSFTTAFSITRITPPTLLPSPYPSDSHHLSGHYLFLPTLTTPTFTLGHAHVEILAQLGPFWHTPLQPCATSLPFHFLLHHPTNTLLLLMDHPAIHRLYLHSFTLSSPTHTSSTFAEFHRPTLLKLLRLHSSTSPPPPTALESALIFIQHEPHRRPCPQCLAPPSNSCSCPLHSLPPPTHSFDLNFFINAMSMHMGIFHSVTTKRAFDPHPGGPRLYMQASRMTMRRCTNRPFVRRVVEWAAMHYRQLRHETPLLALPLQWYGTDINDMYNPRKVARDYGVIEDAPEGLDIEDLLLGANENDEAGEEWTNSMIRGEEMDRVKRKEDAADVGSTLSDTMLSEGGAQCVRIGGNEISVTSAVDERTVGTSELIGCVIDGSDTAATLLGSEENALEILDLVTPGMNVGQAFCDGDSANDILTLAEGSVKSPSPPDFLERNKASEVQVETSATQTKEKHQKSRDDVKARERIEKLRRRRERNRACARRSNLRAKKEREQLLSDLNAAQKRVDDLRGHELGLRRENLRLRRLLIQLN